MTQKKLVAMLFAAGLGTRLKPFTDKHPKALAIVNGKTLLQRNIEYLQSYGIKKVIVNVHHFADQIIKIIKDNKGWGSEVLISDEQDIVLETGGGLVKAKELLLPSEHILLMNVDILTNLNIETFYNNHIQNNVLISLAVAERKTSRYFVFNKSNLLVGWLNESTNETRGIELFDDNIHQKLAFSGIHIIDSKIFSLIQQKGKFSLVDVYLDLMKENKIIAYNHSSDQFIDVGKPESIVKAALMFN